jgi:alcohol dehydrogenase class IV
MVFGSILARTLFPTFRLRFHGLAYAIGAIFHAPHGLATALVLAQALRFNLP